MRISCQNVYCRGTKSDQSSPPKRSKNIDCLTFGFPKKNRIRRRNHFKAIQRNGRRFFGNYLAIQYKQGSFPLIAPLLGISVSKKYGNAPMRNRFKRHVREAFRLNLYLPCMEIVVSPRKGAILPSFREAECDLNLFISYAQLSTKTSC